MATSVQAKISVVIVGGSLNSLGVIRSLSQENMPIYVLETSRRCPAGWSRLCQLIKIRSLEGHSLIEDLKKISMQVGKRPVLILTDDRAVESISAFRNEIEPWYRISLPTDEMVRILADKTLFQKFAEEQGLPVPKSITLDSFTPLLASFQKLNFPVVLKPSNKAHVLNGHVERALRADSLDDAIRITKQMLNGAEALIVQEWIDGPDTEIYFTLFVCDRQGKIAASFTGRKVVCDPPEVGNTAVCVSAPEAAETLEAITRQLVSISKYCGLGSVEFKRDQRNGRYVIIEPTVGRTDWQEEIATLCGVNLPLIAYQIQIYAFIKPALLLRKTNIAWRSSRIHKAPAGQLKRGTRVKDAYFRISDPVPAFYYYGYERFVARLWRKFKKVARLCNSKPIPEIEVEKLSMKVADVVIIGAGPYGLSLAAHLRSEGIPFQIYGTPLESWRSYMPEGMHLKSEPFASNLWDPKRQYTFERFSQEKGITYQSVGKPVPLSLFLEYAEWFRLRTVGETIQVKINRIRSVGERFVLERADGEIVEARRVILATGHMAYRTVPRELTHLTEKVFLHSSSVNRVKHYAGRDVTIVGAGQSAIETAAILQEAGAKVRLVVRKNQIAWNAHSSREGRSFFEKVFTPESGLGAGWKSWAIAELPRIFRFVFAAEKRHRFVATSWGPSGSAWLRNRVEGKVEILLGQKVHSAIETNGKVRLTLAGTKGFQEVITDQVIAATGFRVDFDRIPYLDPELKRNVAREGAAPLLSSNFETSVPNLFVVGISSAPTFGPVMRFMFGAKHAAPIVTRYLKTLTARDARRPALKLLDVKAASES